jgi:hypothetical protein
MSVLETPRIYFKGEVTWDPIVSNNYDTNYDEDTGETIFPAAADKVKAFRAQAISQVVGGNWNPHGTHRAVFYNSTVSAVDVGAGTETNDPFVAAAVQFTGMLVDLEPFGAMSSQLYFDSMHFGIDGGYRILAPRSSRVTGRYINFARNSANTMIAGIASVVWQTSFAKSDGLRVDAFDSKALQTLASALAADDVLGLTVRFNAYRTIYYDDPTLRNRTPATRQAAQRFTAKLQGGGFQPNPARSLMVGAIGLWRKGEPAHEPGDRVLCPAGQSPLGSAYARLGATALTLDLSNSVPEIDDNLKKQDLDDLTVVAVDPDTNATTRLGTFSYAQYDRAAYEASAGIVTVPLVAAAPKGTNLELRDKTATALLAESALRAIPETPNFYLDEGETPTVTFQAYERGAPKAAELPVTIYKMSSDGQTVQNTMQMTTDKNGVLSLTVAGTTGVIFAYVPVLANGDTPPTQGIDTQANTYMYVRIRPGDANVGLMPPTWDNVYAHVLANWNAMAPCMDNWLMLDDPAQVRAHAGMLKRLTDPARFESFRFMPVTRDMSKGERTLLYKFLDAPPDALTRAAAAPPAPLSRNRAALSRAMRRAPSDST